MVQKIYSKMHPVSCTDNHDAPDLENYGMVKNTIIWISWEWNGTFLQNKKNSWPVPNMTHFEKLSFCSGGDL